MTAPRRYYLNACFDLELGGFPTASVRRSCAEMTSLFIPITGPEDCVEVDVALPEDYLQYLRGFGLAAGRVAQPGGGFGDPVVWGWNRSAVERLAPVSADSYPPLKIVRKVNSRDFADAVAHRFGLGVPGTRFCRSLKDVEAAIQENETLFSVVIKPAFGGSGYGFRILQSRGQWDAEKTRIGRLIGRDGVVVEPWLSRRVDLSASTVIDRSGNHSAILFQRQWVNRFGAYFGSYCADDDAVIDPWREQLSSAAYQIAGVVAEVGYFGPIGIDAFVYEGMEGITRLAPAVEINARYTMGMLARELRRLLSMTSPVLLRSITGKRCVLPETIDEWEHRCGDLAFSAQRRSGVLLLTPLRNGFEGTWRQPQRNVFLIAGPSEAEILLGDAQLQELIRPV
jgi:hypothetical protein